MRWNKIIGQAFIVLAAQKKILVHALLVLALLAAILSMVQINTAYATDHHYCDEICICPNCRICPSCCEAQSCWLRTEFISNCYLYCGVQ